MPFRNACFISYALSDSEIMRSLVDDLHAALADAVAMYVDLPVFVDYQRLKPGYRFDEKIAEAICQSVVGIVVFTPSYLQQEWCMRELRAMQLLEQNRLQVLGNAALPGKGFIVPVVLRGSDYLPPEIRDRQFVNFDRYFTGFKPKYFQENVEGIARLIFDWHEATRASGKDLCANCAEFRI
jgi:TIR domain